jgi:orotate phosphoribosyltransferase-like protein
MNILGIVTAGIPLAVSVAGLQAATVFLRTSKPQQMR